MAENMESQPAESGKTLGLNRVLGMIAHTELVSSDPDATRNFLENAFEWNFQSISTPQGELITYETPGGVKGSVRNVRPKEVPISMNYVLVDDLDAAQNKIISLGGEIVMPRVDVPKMGSFFWFKAPGGPILACWADSPGRAMK